MRLRHAISIYFVGASGIMLVVTSICISRFHSLVPAKAVASRNAKLILACGYTFACRRIAHCIIGIGVPLPLGYKLCLVHCCCSNLPALYCILVSVQTDEAWIAAGLMTGMAGSFLDDGVDLWWRCLCSKGFSCFGIGAGGAGWCNFHTDRYLLVNLSLDTAKISLRVSGSLRNFQRSPILGKPHWLLACSSWDPV